MFSFFPLFMPQHNRYGDGKCPDCGFLLSNGATSCPMCSRETTRLQWIAIIALVARVLRLPVICPVDIVRV